MKDDFFFQKIKERYPESVVSHRSFRGDQTVTVHREYLYRVIQFLRSDDDRFQKRMGLFLHEAI